MSNMVKARNYDEDGFVKRAACICVNEDESQVSLWSRCLSEVEENVWTYIEILLEPFLFNILTGSSMPGHKGS